MKSNKKSNKKSFVLAKMPSAGLGNKLFCFCHSIIFAKKNNLEFYFTGLTRIHIGPYLRSEKRKRFYKLLFRKDKKLPPFLLILKRKIVIDYTLCPKQVELTRNTVYTFNQVPHWGDYFLRIREHRSLVLREFTKSLHVEVLARLEQKDSPSIGLHIRMGDFRTLKQNEDFEKVGAVRTPLDYFVDLVNRIRITAQKELDVKIFTDGNKNELFDILALPNVSLAEEDSDVLQLLHLSKSKIIILSAGSTFGQWAAFLSSAAIINHYQHFHSYIRDDETNRMYFEGACPPNVEFPDQIIKNIKSIG